MPQEGGQLFAEKPGQAFSGNYNGGQRSLFEAVLGPVEPLIDPMLRRLDTMLADELLVNTVFQRQAQRRPHSRDRGRPGTPADIILRLLVLQRLRGWTFDETEREVRASLVYRWVSHIYLGPVPDAKTILRHSAVIDDAGVRARSLKALTTPSRHQSFGPAGSGPARTGRR